MSYESLEFRKFSLNLSGSFNMNIEISEVDYAIASQVSIHKKKMGGGGGSNIMKICPSRDMHFKHNHVLKLVKFCLALKEPYYFWKLNVHPAKGTNLYYKLRF